MKSIDIIRAWKDKRQAGSMAPCVTHTAALWRDALWRPALLFALSFLALGACADYESTPEVGEVAQHSYISAGDAWGSGSIPVCWDTGGFAAEKGWVRSAVEGMFENRWEFYIDFTGWGQCAPNWFGYAPGIRISINDEGPHTGGLGSSINGDVGGMVLNFTFNNSSTDGCSTGAVGEAGRRACIEQIASGRRASATTTSASTTTSV